MRTSRDSFFKLDLTSATDFAISSSDLSEFRSDFSDQICKIIWSGFLRIDPFTWPFKYPIFAPEKLFTNTLNFLYFTAMSQQLSCLIMLSPKVTTFFLFMCFIVRINLASDLVTSIKVTFFELWLRLVVLMLFAFFVGFNPFLCFFWLIFSTVLCSLFLVSVDSSSCH